ncbi:hypothetical protein SK128_022479 [Halocaridina rubra]|uniref:Ionotropic glutamate receptor L-glutamate and glycine-binding domain-containing protein n=1 Tax=Halocaridina rubra TaxID=373956 RepID=A0AAN8XE61_HALRR
MKGILTLSIFLFQAFTLHLVEPASLWETISDRAEIQEENSELTFLFDAIARMFTPHCLRVVMGMEPTIWENWEQPLVSIQLSGEESENTTIFMNKNSEKMSRYSCVTYMMTNLPENNVIDQLTNPKDKIISRFFLSKFDTEREADAFLLDQRLLNEENVATVVAEISRNKSEWKIMRRQLLHPSGYPQIKTVNRWSMAEGFYKKNEIFPEQMANFFGKKLQGVTLDFLPFIDYENIPNSRVVIPKPSLDVYILNVIAKTLNFTYDLVMPADGLWGYLREDGHWVGVVGDVEFRRANFSLCLSVTAERLRSVDFTRVYYIDPLTFVTAKNRPQPAWLKLITPFNDHVWLVTVSSVFAAMVLYYFYNKSEVIMKCTKKHPLTAFMDITGSFLGQALQRMPKLTGGQVSYK